MSSRSAHTHTHTHRSQVTRVSFAAESVIWGRPHLTSAALMLMQGKVIVPASREREGMGRGRGGKRQWIRARWGDRTEMGEGKHRWRHRQWGDDTFVE